LGNSGRHPTVNREVADSAAVVIAVPEKCTNLNKDVSDPNEWTTRICSVRVSSVVIGDAKALIEVRSEYDSGSFWLDLEKTYLLFLGRNNRRYFVDNCGNSGLLAARESVLKDVASLAPAVRP
jgi:hypothetical protein